MQIKLRFRGTPAQFGMVVAVTERQWTLLDHKSPIRLGPIDQGSDPDFVIALLEVNSSSVITFKPVEVIAHRLPGGESELTLVADEEHWPSFEPTWKILYEELIRQGWAVSGNEGLLEGRMSEGSSRPIGAGAKPENVFEQPQTKSGEPKPGDKRIVQFEVTFIGTPARFSAMVELFDNRLRAQNVPSWYNGSTDVDPDANYAKATFGSPEGKGWCDVDAQKVSDDKTILFVTAEESDWPLLRESWERLWAEMVRQHLVTPSGVAGGSPIEGAAKNQLSSLQVKILEAIRALRDDYVDPPDEAVATKLGLNRRGQPYTRETINRERGKIRKLGIEV